MNNKDEKTFADLFSSSEKEELKKQSFSNIFDNNEMIDTAPKLEEKDIKNSSITFDSIYDNIVQENKEEETNFDLFSKVAKIDEIVEENVSSKDNLETNSNPSLELELNENKQQLSKDLNPFMSVSFEQDEQKKVEEQVPVSLSSVIFDNSGTDDLKKRDDTFNEDNNNPFFSDDNDSLLVDSKIENDIKTEVSNPLFDFQNNQDDSASEFSNPFFDNDNIEKDKLQSELIENNDSVEPELLQDNNSDFFFGSEVNLNTESGTIQSDTTVENVLETNDLNNNPFLEIDNNSEKSTDSVVKEEKEFVLQKNEKALEEQEEPKSSSPFFQEENTNSAENPFFQNQLNLVENKQVDTPIGTINTNKVKHYNVKVEKKKEPLLKFIIGVFSYALFIFLLLIGITLLIYVLDIKIRAAKGDYTAPTFNAYVVLTGSMLPDIEIYDVVVTKKIDAKDLKEKDIITFASDDSRFRGTIITHRIIKKNPPSADSKGYTFQTKGDNNNVADSALVPEANIYGKVILKIPKLGYLQEFLASDGGWIIVILIPCLVVISYDIVKLAKGLKRKKYKNIKVQK